MPLPAYLLERLKKRNVIQDSTVINSESSHSVKSEKISESSYQQDNKSDIQKEKIDEDDQEEIIAEDYSDEDQSDNQSLVHERDNLSYSDDEQDEEQNCSFDSKKVENLNSNLDTSKNNAPSLANNRIDEENLDATGEKNDMIDKDNSSMLPDLLDNSQSILGCPNKYNIYHHCSQYCIDNYSNLDSMCPTIEQRKQLAILLKTYPISNEWTVVYDPGVKTFYFWNIVTNLVSWLPPGMNGLISLSADQIKKSMLDHQEQQQDLNECFEE